MKALGRIGIQGLQELVAYFTQNIDNTDKIISDFGEVTKDNGYGTLFLSPKNKLFKVFWIYLQDNKLVTVGFGGPGLGLYLSDLLSIYDHYTESFSPHDNEYIYVFYTSKEKNHSIKISSHGQLFDQGRPIQNITVNGVEINLLC